MKYPPRRYHRWADDQAFKGLAVSFWGIQIPSGSCRRPGRPSLSPGFTHNRNLGIVGQPPANLGRKILDATTNSRPPTQVFENCMETADKSFDTTFQ